MFEFCIFACLYVVLPSLSEPWPLGLGTAPTFLGDVVQVFRKKNVLINVDSVAPEISATRFADGHRDRLSHLPQCATVCVLLSTQVGQCVSSGLLQAFFGVH